MTNSLILQMTPQQSYYFVLAAIVVIAACASAWAVWIDRHDAARASISEED
mgnify:CR=1 FL=1